LEWFGKGKNSRETETKTELVLHCAYGRVFLFLEKLKEKELKRKGRIFFVSVTCLYTVLSHCHEEEKEKGRNRGFVLCFF